MRLSHPCNAVDTTGVYSLLYMHKAEKASWFFELEKHRYSVAVK